MLRRKRGSAEGKSMSTTCLAPSAAATNPTRPVPAPSSTTFRPLTRLGLTHRCAESECVDGQTPQPVTSSPSFPLAFSASCSTVIGCKRSGAKAHARFVKECRFVQKLIEAFGHGLIFHIRDVCEGRSHNGYEPPLREKRNHPQTKSKPNSAATRRIMITRPGVTSTPVLARL